MSLKVLALSNEEKTELERLKKFDSDWRVRERAETLLLLCAGCSCLEVAEKMKLHFRTISYTRKAWLEEKFQSLPDRPRCGAPLKITPPGKSQYSDLGFSRAFEFRTTSGAASGLWWHARTPQNDGEPAGPRRFCLEANTRQP